MFQNNDLLFLDLKYMNLYEQEKQREEEFAMTEVGFANLQCLSVGIGCNEIRRPSELCGGPQFDTFGTY